MALGTEIALIKALGGNDGGGSGGGVLVVHQSGNDLEGYTLDKTWQEIFDADYPILVLESEYEKEYLLISNVLMEAEQSYIVVVSNDAYGTTSADGYPQKPGGK